MSDRDFQHSSTQTSSPKSSSASESVSDMVAKASELAGEAADKVRHTANETAATISGEIKHLLDRQVSGGATMAGHLASSTKRAAEDLDRDVPQLAAVVRVVADQIDGFAGNLQGQTVDQLVKGAGDFTRRQPALMFGLAAVAGFFIVRTLKSTPATIASPPIQASNDGHPSSSSSFHGS